MLATTELRFGEWLPSQPDYANPGCTVVRNVYPTPGGYGPLPAPVATSQSVAGAVRSSRLFFGVDGSICIAGGTATSLFKSLAGTVTSTTGLTDIGLGETWDFARFNDILIATSLANNPKYLDDLDTDTTWSDLPGSPPKARVVERVEDFVMLGDIAGSPNRIQWSGLNAPAASWTPNRQTQAGFADLPRVFGRVQKIVGGRYPLVFQERGVSRLTYVGPPTVWRVDEIEQGRGTIAPGSVIGVGFLTYYLAQDGWYVTDGSSVQPLGNQRVNNWFFRTADITALSQIQAAVDWENRCVAWLFRAAGATALNSLLLYSWSENRWSFGDAFAVALLSTQLGGLSIEDVGALYGSFESVPGSLDDERFRARSRVLGLWVFDGTNSVLHTLSGDATEALFVTGEFQPAPLRRSLIAGARVLARGCEQAEAAVYSYENDRGEVSTAFAAPGVDGRIPLRADAMTHRLAVRFPAGCSWRDAQGAQVTFRVSGAR